MTYPEFLNLLMGLGGKTPLGQMIHTRKDKKAEDLTSQELKLVAEWNVFITKKRNKQKELNAETFMGILKGGK